MKFCSPALFLAAFVLVGLSSRPAQAQYYDNLGYQHNNSVSATIGTWLNGQPMLALGRNRLYTAMYMAGHFGRRRSRPTAAQLQERRGKALIKRGRATMTFTPRPFPIKYWMANTVVDKSVSAEEDRRTRYNGMIAQRQYWAEQARARGAKTNDMADMMALGTVIALEAYNQQRPSNEGFRKQSSIFRKSWLKDPYYQGHTRASKQQFIETQMLGATYAWWLRNKKGDEAKAQERAEQWLDTWFPGKTASVVAAFKPYVSGSPAPSDTLAALSVQASSPDAAAEPEAEDAPTLTYAEAEKITRFSPAGQSLLPALFSEKQPAEKRAETRKLYDRMLSEGAGKLRGFFSAPPSGQQDVAEAMTFAVITFYTTLKSPSGNVQEAGFNQKNLNAMGEQITRMLAANPAIRNGSAQQKQQLWEGMVLLSTLTGALVGEAQRTGDAQLRRQAEILAREGMQSLLGVTPDKLRLTDQGLAAK